MKIFRFIGIMALVALGLFPLPASAADSVEGVTIKDGKIYSLKGDQQALLAENLKFADKIEVSTNGTFKVDDGKERKLGEGQILRSDGWLLDTDGSVTPAMDHVAMKSGKVYVVRDGQSSSLTQTLQFPNGLIIHPDTSCIYPDGASTRLMDGQLFRLDGTAIPARDTISMKNGHVIVQKDGKLIPLLPVQLMGMSDGTRVRGTGLVEKGDGTTLQLREGQTILVEGALVRR